MNALLSFLTANCCQGAPASRNSAKCKPAKSVRNGERVP
jgi:hypothetical protein